VRSWKAASGAHDKKANLGIHLAVVQIHSASRKPTPLHYGRRCRSKAVASGWANSAAVSTDRLALGSLQRQLHGAFFGSTVELPVAQGQGHHKGEESPQKQQQVREPAWSLHNPEA